jgi:hypothetical protein
MFDLLKPVFQSALTGFAALAILFAFMFFKEYLSFRLRMKKLETHGIDDEAEQSSDTPEQTDPGTGRFLDDPKHVVSSNFQLLEKYYEQTLAEYRLNSRATLAIAMAGFVAILIGIGIAYSGVVAIGLVSTAAGVLAEAATVLFFRQNREQIRQVQEYHKKLVSTQYLLTAVSLADSLDGSGRVDEVRRIILNLLYLSNELHGSRSPHLFPDHQGHPLSSETKSAFAELPNR